MNDSKLIIDKLDSIHEKIERILVENAIVKEKTLRNEEDIKEIKDKMIPTAIKAASNKMKLWVYSGAIGILITIAMTFVKSLK